MMGRTHAQPRPRLRFRTGKTVENAVVFPTFSVLAVLLLPGAADILNGGIDTYVSTTGLTRQP
ncbi:MAG: hypothetical protein ACRDT2_15770 [Natronosporangium sp.]